MRAQRQATKTTQPFLPLNLNVFSCLVGGIFFKSCTGAFEETLFETEWGNVTNLFSFRSVLCV